MLGKVGEVDEEVTALRREIVGSEREARALRVQVLKFTCLTSTKVQILIQEREARALCMQKNKLDRLTAALKSQRLWEQISGAETSEAITSEMHQLLHITAHLRFEALTY